MPSPHCKRAIEDAVRIGKAFVKILAPNDCKATNSHQSGYYLPKIVREMFTPVPPTKGINGDSPVKVTWQNGLVTDSKVKWYGAAKDEYRLTCFGRGFPYREADAVGSLLVLVVQSQKELFGYTLDDAEDIDEVLTALNIQMTDKNWSVYDVARDVAPETENQCVERKFRQIAQALEDFPKTEVFSEKAREVLICCVKDLANLSADEQLVAFMDAEYALFKLCERQICQGSVQRLFRDMDDFLRTASSLMQRRKSRAGYSLEHHVGYILKGAGIPFAIRSSKVPGRPDVIIPSANDYNDESFPDSQLFMVGIKTTCKDRWRQIIQEAPRIKTKHILTLQQSISKSQLVEMRDARVVLVVPAKIKKQYPEVEGMKILSVAEFVDSIRRSFKAS
jgi:hypothetical protein